MQMINQPRIIDDIIRTLKEFIPDAEKLNVIDNEDIENISSLIFNDLIARVSQDPVALNDEYIYKISRSFKIIFYYRIAHYLFNIEADDLYYKYCAFQISEYATSITAIEIHPQAKIGKSFVIDHGVNTLIGATSEIGDNCTILQNVVLGARKITYNENVKRHPTVGNNVHISGGVRILGPIKVGNNVSIGPDCLIAEDIADNTIIRLKKVQLITKTV